MPDRGYATRLGSREPSEQEGNLVRASWTKRELAPTLPATGTQSSSLRGDSRKLADETTPFGPVFWLTYAANTLLMIGVSLMFRYSDFVVYLGGTDYDLGWIVGIGMFGALAMRVLQGTCIDRWGPGNIWLGSMFFVLASLLLHLLVQRIDGVWIYLLRMLYTVSLAGAFGASITFCSLRAPAHRTGEVIGALGSSGFVGMAVGPAASDWLFARPGSERSHVDSMFLVAAAVTGVALISASLARSLAGRPRITSRRSPPAWWVIVRYHPGSILLMGIVMGMGISIPFTFLRPFALQLGIDGIRSYFVVYASVAFVVRILCRRFPDNLGVPRTIVLGMTFLTLEMLSFLWVTKTTGLMLPATLGGIAHAFVFPAAMTGGSLAFPARYRGLATTLMLTMVDLGNLIGQPAIGTIIHFAPTFGLTAYPTMFLSVATLMFTATIAYAVTCPKSKSYLGNTSSLLRA